MRLTYEETTSYAHFFSFIKGKKIPCYYQLISCDWIWTCVSASSTHTHAVNEFYPINIEGLIVKEWSRSKRKTYQTLSIFNRLSILKCCIMIFCQKSNSKLLPFPELPMIKKGNSWEENGLHLYLSTGYVLFHHHTRWKLLRACCSSFSCDLS